MFQVDQKNVYQQINVETKSSEKPDAKESKEFWSNIWDKEVKHNTQAEWIQELKEESVGGEKQGDLVITTDMVTKQKIKRCLIGRALDRMESKDIGLRT